MSSAIISPPIQVARIENNNIAARESVNISVISVNVYQRDQKASGLLTNPGRNGKPELIGKATMLEKVVRKLERTLRSTVDSSGQYLALILILERISEVTIPRIITLASRSRLVEAPTKVKLLAEVNYLLLLLKDFSQNFTLRLKSRPTRHSSAYAAWRPPRRTLSDKIESKAIKKLYRELERSCGRADSILLSFFKDPAPNVLQEQTEIEDFFGARWFLPQYICLNQQAFNAVLFARYKGGIAESVINQGRFKVSTLGRLEITNQNDWERIISAGASIQLSVLVQCLREKDVSRVGGTVVQCPRCRQSQTICPDKSEGWVDCGQCQSSFTVNFREASDNEGVQALRSPGASNSQEAHPCENGVFRYYAVENILVGRKPTSAPHHTEPQSEQLMALLPMEGILSSDFWDNVLLPGYNANGVTGGYVFGASDSGPADLNADSPPSASRTSFHPSNLLSDQLDNEWRRFMESLVYDHHPSSSHTRWDQNYRPSLPQTSPWPAWTPTLPVQQQQNTQYQGAGWLQDSDIRVNQQPLGPSPTARVRQDLELDNDWRRFMESIGVDYYPSSSRNNIRAPFLQAT